ncbi:restriction endonuclease subunit S [Clostridium baratii]|uniref:restriction endonuclease subunit S n=1 Tax=Clostridium baratii TaxID=1561 RepID=UPI002A75A789|nr:restriction endonuclease subunit S [Clostridium baratii]MDY3208818.1 restriction endonuclease subunit S [Clostridium baratii]
MSFKYKALGECIELIIDNRGKTPKKMGGDWVAEGVRTISAKNVHGGKLDNFDSIRCVSQEVYKKWMKKDIKRGDCLLVSEGATLGENLYWNSDEKVVIGQRLYCIRTNNNILYSKYFAAYMNTHEYQKEIEGKATGTSVLGIKQTDLLKTKVLIKDIKEQIFIGDLYFKINEKIETNNKINKTLEEMAQAIFKQWFVDFEFPNEDGKPYKSSGGEMVESELGFIPNGWDVIEFSDIINISSGKRPMKKNTEKTSEFFIPLVGASSIMGYVKEYNYDEPILIIGRVGTHGVVQRFNDKVWASDNTLVITSNYPEFAYQILNRIDYSALNRGSTQPLITQTDIKKHKIVKANFSLIDKYERIIGDIFKSVYNNNKQNEQLIITRDTLLPKLMSGEIRVPLD